MGQTIKINTNHLKRDDISLITTPHVKLRILLHDKIDPVTIEELLAIYKIPVTKEGNKNNKKCYKMNGYIGISLRKFKICLKRIVMSQLYTYMYICITLTYTEIATIC